ncbi:MAG: DUF2127 domain-containing protein [Candidatus Dormibacteria bacterium]
MAEAAARRPASWWQRLRRDLGLRIEHRGFVLWYLIVERGLKGLLLLVVALYVGVHARTGLNAVGNRFVEQFSLDSGSNVLRRAIFELILRFAGMSHSHLVALAAGSFLYGVIEASEAVGLLLRRRWAEYLVVLATAFFIPLEAYEVVHHVTPLKLVTLVINIVVVVYLVRKKRLFAFDEPPGER